MNFGNRNIRKFNELVNEVDAEVAQLDLTPLSHGKIVLEKIHKHLN